MAVIRLVANIEVAPGDTEIAQLEGFYAGLFDLSPVMSHGWIVTLANAQSGPIQLSIASQGGSDTPVPALSIEVDDLDVVLARVQEKGIALEYGPVTEPWGVRRFYIRDPVGTLLNVLTHCD